MKYTVIIDYGHIFHACRSVAVNVPPPHTLLDSIVYHSLSKLRTLHRVVEHLGIRDYDTILVEDRPATRKLNLLPTYRAGRENRSEEKAQVKALMKERGCQGYWCWSEGNEADDTMATLVEMAKLNGVFSIIVTGDRDLWQLMGQTVSILNPIKKEIVTTDDVKAAFDVWPSHVPLVKAFWGDSGDCVPNVMPRMRKHLLPTVRLSDGTFDDCHAKIMERQASIHTKCLQLYHEQEALARRNYNLVKLDSACPLTWD